jgi:aryl-alcohol dehydrogenase-like predicted oxidoreductase
MSVTARLGLGTAQFAFDYGATNKRGRIGEDEARRIMQMAPTAGMSLIHSFSTYGDCESLLGREAETIAPMRIASKLPPIRAATIGTDEVAALGESLKRSRARLGRGCIDGVLFHDARELHMPGAERAIDMLREAKARGKIGRIRVTAYNPPELSDVFDIFDPEVVQIPLNLLDQRFTNSGLLAALKEKGAEIHARSVFLQGTLLVEPDRLPSALQWARPVFASAAQFIAKRGYIRLLARLGYGLSVHEVDSLVLGVTGANELAEILDTIMDLPTVLPDCSGLAIDDERVVNPALWQPTDEAITHVSALPLCSPSR